jgi:hypothetical protein
MEVSATNLSDGTLSISKLYPVSGPDGTPVYDLYSIRRITNNAGVTHRIRDMYHDGNNIKIIPLGGYEFTNGMVLEVIAEARSNNNPLNFRNGAALTMTPRLRKIDNFTQSVVVDATVGGLGTVAIYLPGMEIAGCSTTDMTNLNQSFSWITNYAPSHIIPVNVSGFGTDTLDVDTGNAAFSGEVLTIQLLIKENVLAYDSVLVNYNYTSSQCQTLPLTLTVEPVLTPPSLFVSNLGPTGGIAGEPYELPFEHIAINDDITDSMFCNKLYLKIADMLINSGFAQIPVTIPGNFIGQSLTFSGASSDMQSRAFYSICSQDISFSAEGLQLAVPRKVYIPIIAKVKTASNIFIADEYLMIILSRTVLTDKENRTGMFADSNCSASVYRLPNRPMKK